MTRAPAFGTAWIKLIGSSYTLLLSHFFYYTFKGITVCSGSLLNYKQILTLFKHPAPVSAIG